MNVLGCHQEVAADFSNYKLIWYEELPPRIDYKIKCNFTFLPPVRSATVDVFPALSKPTIRRVTFLKKEQKDASKVWSLEITFSTTIFRHQHYFLSQRKSNSVKTYFEGSLLLFTQVKQFAIRLIITDDVSELKIHQNFTELHLKHDPTLTTLNSFRFYIPFAKSSSRDFWLQPGCFHGNDSTRSTPQLTCIRLKGLVAKHDEGHQSRAQDHFGLLSAVWFCLSLFPKLRRAFPVGDDFLNQHWSVEVYSHRKAWVYFFSPKWWHCSF